MGLIVGGCSVGKCKACLKDQQMLDEDGLCDDCVEEIEHEGLDAPEEEPGKK